ncbi:DUF1642 domain-containing protein [Enterococcus faecium]|nr:DUF1642 domain-containing protein [Enterococcus faecium]
MDELITKVEQWAKDKGLNQADPKAQFLKVAEEFGEIASAMARSNDELFKDSVGDVIVTLIILSMQKGTNIQECLEMAYNEIKGRTGKMVDGVFVKSSDLKQLDEPQKPFVPKFVADYIEEYRGGGATLYEMMDSSEDEVYTWLFGNPRIETENERQLLFAQAYAVGYEVEEEPKWVVKSNRLYFTGITQLIAREPITYNFTTDEKRAHVFDDKESAEKEASFFDGTVEKVKV